MGSYGNSAAALQQLIDARKYSSIVPFLEDLELQVGGTTTDPDWPYTVHILGYLINNDLDNARYLYKRTPQNVKEVAGSQVQAAWRLTQALWTQDYQTVHITLRDFAWGAQATPVARHLKDVVRARVIALVSRAYTTISAVDAAAFLGLSPAETIQMVEGMGWLLQADTQMLTVKACVVEEQQRTTPLQLQQLTEYVVHLEG